MREMIQPTGEQTRLKTALSDSRSKLPVLEGNPRDAFSAGDGVESAPTAPPAATQQQRSIQFRQPEPAPWP